MNRKHIIIVFTVLLIACSEGRKTSSRSRGSGSGRGSSKKTNYNPQPAPTSFSHPQPSAPKPSLFGWQERPAQKSNTQSLSSYQPKPSSGQSHSYPSSGTGLSGNKPKQPATNQESIQRSSASSNAAGPQRSSNGQSHAYPSSNGLSGSGGSAQSGYPQSPGSGLSGNGQSQKSGYPQSQSPGLSGSGQQGGSYNQQSGYPHGSVPGSGYPQHSGSGYQNQHGSAMAGPPPPYPGHTGQNYQGNSYHPQGPPPPYTPYGSNYGGIGGHGSYGPYNTGYGSQMPGYFGNYGKGNTGLSRTGSALTGVGIAGAGIGTVLTGLALWNLARSTGHHHHTVIYDNRGQPVAVAPANDTTPVADSILADLENCSLTISNDDKTEVLAIPCSIATSFTPNADVKESGVPENATDNTKCTITVLTKAGKEFMTTIPCSILLNTAAENNVTEPPPIIEEPGHLGNSTTETSTQNSTLSDTSNSQPTALRLSGGEDLNNNSSSQLNCTPHPGEIRDPINPCYAVNHNLTVIPLPVTDAPK